MADKSIQIAVILSAYDKMSAIVNRVVANSSEKLQQLQKISEKASQASFAYGRRSMATGTAISVPLIAAAKAYGDQEDALLRMKAAMMQDGGRLDQNMFTQLQNYAQNTSERLTGTTEDYLKMIKVLQENSIKPKEILGGIGDSVADLSVFFHMAPDTIAQFAARMRQDMGILPKEMQGMMDVIARLNNAGVGKDGAEAVNEMSEAFSKAGLGAHNLGVSGLQASKDLGALMGIFIRRGLSGGTVGTNFRRIFDGLRDADKIKKANEVAKQFGITLDFYDKNHQFKGIAAFTGEINKLKGLRTDQISQVLKPFGGKQGLSTDFLEFLGKEGTSSFNDLQHKMANQATLTAKVKLMMGGLNNEVAITKTTAINTAAAIGSTYSPELKELAHNLNTVFKATTDFTLKHKGLVSAIAKGVLYFAGFKIGIGGIAMVFGALMKAVGGAAKVIFFFNNGAGKMILLFIGRLGGLIFRTVIPALWSMISATWAWTAALLANPVTWIVLAIIALAAAAYLVYKNWDPITKWFSKQWTIMKAQIAGTMAVLGLFMDVLIGAGKVYLGIFTFNPALIKQGFAQGAAAVQSIMNGGIGKAYNHAYDLSINTSKATAKPSINSPAGKGGDVHHHYSPVIHVHGGTPSDGKGIVDKIKPHLEKFMKDKQHKTTRTSYQ